MCSIVSHSRLQHWSMTWCVPSITIWDYSIGVYVFRAFSFSATNTWYLDSIIVGKTCRRSYTCTNCRRAQPSNRYFWEMTVDVAEVILSLWGAPVGAPCRVRNDLQIVWWLHKYCMVKWVDSDGRLSQSMLALALRRVQCFIYYTLKSCGWDEAD